MGSRKRSFLKATPALPNGPAATAPGFSPPPPPPLPSAIPINLVTDFPDSSPRRDLQEAEAPESLLPALSISLSSPQRTTATAARVGSATGDDSIAPAIGSKSPLFEKGRLYDLYSARRNERLKRKMAECSEAAAVVVTEDPAVAVVLAKRRLSKKAESARKSVLAHFPGSRGSSSRSAAAGSSKEKSKAGSSFAASECSSAGGGRRNGSVSVR